MGVEEGCVGDRRVAGGPLVLRFLSDKVGADVEGGAAFLVVGPEDGVEDGGAVASDVVVEAGSSECVLAVGGDDAALEVDAADLVCAEADGVGDAAGIEKDDHAFCGDVEGLAGLGVLVLDDDAAGDGEDVFFGVCDALERAVGAEEGEDS